jgi:hypothetical protein
MDMPPVETILFNGIKFRRYPGSKRWPDRNYYKPHSGHIRQGVGSLHRELWKAINGPIPSGHHIHHKDENPRNNELSNLVCLSAEDHAAHHAENAGLSTNEWLSHLAEIRPKASAWHKSEAGRLWHVKHGKLTWTQREAIGKPCESCGKMFDSITLRKNDRFCSNSCKTRQRRLSGVDNVSRVCVICGNTFTVNRYIPKQTCSRLCHRLNLSKIKKSKQTAH